MRALTSSVRVTASRGARRVLASLAAGLVALPLLSGCSGQGGADVVFLMADNAAERWTVVDAPVMAQQLDELCEGCSFDSAQAGGDVETQREQFEQAIDDGARVVVLNAVDAEVAHGWLRTADPEVTVVAYDRFVTGADFHLAVDSTGTGTLMAQALVDQVGRGAAVLMVEGPAEDSSSRAIAAAAQTVFEQNKIQVVDTVRPKSWDAAPVRSAVVKRGEQISEVKGIFASNDVQAAGVVEGLQELGVKGKSWPAVSGQDAELAAVRRVIAGTQSFTVYKELRTLASETAKLAVALLTETPTREFDESGAVPSLVLTPSVVTRDTVARTILRDRVYSLEQLCEGETAQACVELSLR